MSSKILVIDDDPNTVELISLILKPRDLETYHALNGQEGLKLAYELQPDLIILDVMMPEYDGFEICSRLREFSDVPILMLTAKSQSSDVTRGFAVGADDYVKKPFENDILISRIENLLRRNKASNTREKIKEYSDDVLQIELEIQKVQIKGKEVALTPTEFNLLAFLVRHPQKTLSTRTLLREVWGDAYSHDKSLLSLYIHQLRQKLKEAGADHDYIQTQWGQGYWFNPLPKKVEKKPVENGPVQKASGETTADKTIYGTTFKLVGIIVVLILVAVTMQTDQIFGFILGYDKSYTELEALMTADGFIEDDTRGVQGQICVSNSGHSATRNLSIVTTVQAVGGNVGNIYTTSLDISEHPQLEADETHCYPYKIVMDTLASTDSLKMNAIITITNYMGLYPGSKHCPGEDPCAFGPNLLTEFTFPEP